MRKRDINIRIFLIIFLLILFSLTASGFQKDKGSQEPMEPLPHIFYGFAYYDDTSTPADGAEVTIRNLRNGEEAYSNAYPDGYYSIIINADPDESYWLDGDPAVIIISGIDSYDDWIGFKEITVDLNVEPQTVDDILLLEGIEKTYNLHQGWNILTLPAETYHSARTLGESIPGCTIVSRWDASIQRYLGYIVDISPPEFDFEIKEGVGYWVYVQSETTFSIFGPPITDVAIDLYVGWNVIGWYKETSTMASILADNIPDCTLVSRWDASIQRYRGYIVGISPSEFDFGITCGMGIYVYVVNDSIWYGNP